MSWDEIYKLISKLSAISVIVPLAMCLLRLPHLRGGTVTLFCYLLMCGVADFLGYAFLSLQERMDLIMNVFTLIEFCLLSVFYLSTLKTNKTLVILASALVMILVFKKFIVDNEINNPDVLVSSATAAILTVYASLFLYRQLNDPLVIRLESQGLFWINMAFLLYFSVSFLLFFSNDFITSSSRKVALILWTVHQILNLTSNLLISIGIWKTRQRQP